MLNSKRLAATLLAVSLLGSSTMLATAQEAPVTETQTVEPAAKEGMWQGLKAKFGGRRDGKTGGRHGGLMHAMFAEVDADKNGAVTLEEINEYRSAKVAAADTSKDGAISLEEFTAAFTAMMKDRTEKSFKRLDTNGDGSITTAELDSTVNTMFAKMDRNDDGLINKDDRPEKGRKGKGRHISQPEESPNN